MPKLLCPVCGEELIQEEKRYYCSGGHSFDRAGSGYVNLLISCQNGKIHGDDRQMVRARRDFLEKGYYEPLRKAICSEILALGKEESMSLLDSGCGECWYTSGVEKVLADAGPEPDIVGMDISKDALKMGDKRGKNLRLAVASAYRLPIGDESCDAILNVFAPFAGEEYLRVLKKGGALIHVSPGEKHLWELKKAVYEKPYLNDAAAPAQDGLELSAEKELKFSIEIDNNADIKALFMMTPYAHKTGLQNIKRLEELQNLSVVAEFVIRVYKKK